MCDSNEGLRRFRHAQALRVVALLEAHALAVGTSNVLIQRQWTSSVVKWHRFQAWATPEWDCSACAAARLAQSRLGSERRAVRCCALPFGVQLPTDCPYAPWGWSRPRDAPCAQLPVAHAPEARTGCTAVRCSASDSLVESEPCEYGGRLREARLHPLWSMSSHWKCQASPLPGAHRSRRAASLDAERVRRTNPRP